jgi:hypothetical protein
MFVDGVSSSTNSFGSITAKVEPASIGPSLGGPAKLVFTRGREREDDLF